MDTRVKLFSVQFYARDDSTAAHDIPITLAERVLTMLGAAFTELVDDGLLDFDIQDQD